MNGRPGSSSRPGLGRPKSPRPDLARSKIPKITKICRVQNFRKFFVFWDRRKKYTDPKFRARSFQCIKNGGRYDILLIRMTIPSAAGHHETRPELEPSAGRRPAGEGRPEERKIRSPGSKNEKKMFWVRYAVSNSLIA